MDAIAQLTAKRLQQETEQRDMGALKLRAMVDRNYEQWQKLFDILQERGIYRYPYLAAMLKEVGVQTNPDALAKAFKYVRDKRAEQAGKIVTPAGQTATETADRQRYSFASRAPVQSSAEARPESAKTVSPPPIKAASRAVLGEISWSSNPYVFCGVELDRSKSLVAMVEPVRGVFDEVLIRGKRQDALACLDFLQAIHSEAFHSQGEGESLVPQDWLPYFRRLVEGFKRRL
ncbi:hypothetical protein [Variovorax sp. W2I14]|uniref:hypothetical protein n=1 Tax=Variovorax sp. W2I14 TaxID=3042290 RepID=UPI003D20D647